MNVRKNDRVTRIALLLVLLAGAALVVRHCVRNQTESESPIVATDDSDPGTPFVPGHGPEIPNAPDAGSVTPTPDTDPMPRREVGEPLAEGTLVELSRTYRPGTTSRYRITNATMQRNRETNVALAQQWFSEVTTVVEAVEDDGSVRVRLTMDAVRLQAALPNGQMFDFDSRAPDEFLLQNPQVAFTVRPMIATLGKPIEFRLGPHGGPIEVTGLQDWQDAWAEELEHLEPGASRKLGTPYAPDSVMLEWSELLFPPVLGGQLAAGEDREVEILRDTQQKTYIQFLGPLNATHDDGDVFRVRMRAKPSSRPRPGTPRSAAESAVAKTRVVSDADAYHAAWRFSRKQGRLIDAEIDAKYQFHVSWSVGTGGTVGGGQYTAVFVDDERRTRVELLPPLHDGE